jgi:hypothetical protein
MHSGSVTKPRAPPTWARASTTVALTDAKHRLDSAPALGTLGTLSSWRGPQWSARSRTRGYSTLWLGRARGIGHARQHLDLLGYALMVTVSHSTVTSGAELSSPRERDSRVTTVNPPETILGAPESPLKRFS